MRPVTLKWSAVIVISVAAQALVYNDMDVSILPVVTLWFLLFCPGMAFVQLLQLENALHEVVLAVALSIALDIIVAATVLYTGFWSPRLIHSILIYLSLVGVVCHLCLWLARTRVDQSSAG